MEILFISVLLLLLLRIPIIRLAIRTGESGGADAYFHLWAFRKVRDARGKLKAVNFHTYILDETQRGVCAYPLGYHHVLYRLGFTEMFLRTYGAYLPLVWDVLLLGILFASAEMFGAGANVWFLLIPLQYIFSIDGNRSYSFTERSFGVLVSSLYLFGMVALLQYGFTWYTVASSVIGFLLFASSSKFSYQATFFITAFLSVVLLNPYFIAHWIAHFVLACLLLRGYPWTVLSGSIRYLVFYVKQFAVIAGLRRKDIFRSAALLPVLLVRGKFRAALSIFYRNSLWLIISGVPLHILVVRELLVQPEWGVWQAMWMAGIVGVVLVSLPPLRFLGLPERYMEYTFIALAVRISFAPVVSGAGMVVGMLTALGVVYTVWRRRTHSKNIAAAVLDESEMLRWLVRDVEDSGTRPVVLWTCPRTSKRLACTTDACRIVGFVSGVAVQDRSAVAELFLDTYNAVRPDIERVVDRYEVEYVVVDKVAARQAYEDTGVVYYESLPGECVYDTKWFSVWRVRS